MKTIAPVVNLSSSPIFRRAVRYNDAVLYPQPQPPALEPEELNAPESFAEQLVDLIMTDQLDWTDIRIIQALKCSPAPSEREIAHNLGIPKTTIHRKRTRLATLFKGI